MCSSYGNHTIHRPEICPFQHMLTDVRDCHLCTGRWRFKKHSGSSGCLQSCQGKTLQVISKICLKWWGCMLRPLCYTEWNTHKYTDTSSLAFEFWVNKHLTLSILYGPSPIHCVKAGDDCRKLWSMPMKSERCKTTERCKASDKERERRRQRPAPMIHYD